MRSFGFLLSFFVSCFWRCAIFITREAQLHGPRWSRRIIIGIAMGCAAWRLWPAGASRPAPDDTSPAPTITQIRALAELVTAKVTITDARETTLGGYLGDVKAILIIRGDALLGPDLSQAKILSADQTTKRMVIELPRPHLISYRLDHSATRLVSLSHDGLWMIVPGDAGRTAVVNRAYAEAEQIVKESAVTPDTVKEAADHAQDVLKLFLGSAKWNVEVRWATSA